MFNNRRLLVVIPARGGSVGIPRKNVSLLKERPLIYYVVHAALASRYVDRVLVSTNDDEVAHLASVYGAAVMQRRAELCRDDVTLDSVVHDAAVHDEQLNNVRYDAVLTIQPTSPLITGHTIDSAIESFYARQADTLLTVSDDTHLRWGDGGEPGLIVPLYEKRLNRQWLPKAYRETGAINIARRDYVTPTSRFGPRVVSLVMDELESVDIDSRLDWMLCDKILSMTRLVFVVTGSSETGTGHAYRAMTLAQCLVEHNVRFVCTPGSDVAMDLIKTRKYPVEMLHDGDLAEQVLAMSPQIVINDALDTDADYVARLKKAGVLVVNFEDEGAGAAAAHLVINALYGNTMDLPHCYSGQDYFCLRSEFKTGAEYQVRPQTQKVLLTFGGTDPSNLTSRALAAIDDFCAENGIEITILVGVGYAHRQQLERQMAGAKSRVVFANGASVVSNYMRDADVAITSCGRTVYELASLGVPTIAIAHNERESRHTFIAPGNGIWHMGSGRNTTEDDIREAFRQIAGNQMMRQIMHASMRKHDLSAGLRNVRRLIFDRYEVFRQCAR